MALQDHSYNIPIGVGSPFIFDDRTWHVNDLPKAVKLKLLHIYNKSSNYKESFSYVFETIELYVMPPVDEIGLPIDEQQSRSTDAIHLRVKKLITRDPNGKRTSSSASEYL